MGDSTFQDLPYVGETDPKTGKYDPNGTLALFINTLRTEAINDRNNHTMLHPICESLYLYGTEKPGEPHTFPKIQGMIDTFYALATATDPTATVKLMTHLDGGPIIPSTANEPVIFDGAALSDFIQRQLDYTVDKSRGIVFFQSIVKNSMIYGWQNALIEWDGLKDEPRYRVIPALQWYMQPTEEELANMATLGLDWPIDAQDAKRDYPEVADDIDRAAQRSIYTQPGAAGYSGLYYGFALARPLVTLSVWWIRNRIMPMTDQEAIDGGQVEAREVPMGGQDDTAVNPTAATPPAGDSGKPVAGDNGGLPDAAGQGGGAVQPAPMREALFHKDTGEELNADHPQWPHKLVTSQTIQIQGDVVYDGECKEWDFPVVANYNVRIPNQPYGQSECIRVRSPQNDVNQLNKSIMNHTNWFKGPTIIADNRLQERLPTGAVRNLGMKSDTTYWFDSQGGTLKVSDLITVIKPPELPPALLEVKRDQVGTFNDAGNNPAIQQGNSPTANSSGILAQTLMQASTSTASTKFKYLEEFWWRTCMLIMHNIRERRTAEQMYNIDRTYPVEVIEQIILPFWKSVEISLTVTVAGGQSKAAKEMAVREDFQMQLIDAETACDMLGYDYKQIQQRRSSAMVAGGVAGSMPGQTPAGGPPGGGSQVPAASGGPVPSTVPAPAESAVQ